PFPNDEYTFGWVCTRDIEFEAAMGMMDEVHGVPQDINVNPDNNQYVLGSIGVCNVVVGCLPFDEFTSASALIGFTCMLRSFPNIRFHLNVGTGAGMPNIDQGADVRLGDVVLGKSTDKGAVVVCDFETKVQGRSYLEIAFATNPPEQLGSAVEKLVSRHIKRPNTLVHHIEHMLHKYPDMRKRIFSPVSGGWDRLFPASEDHVGVSIFGRYWAKGVDRKPRQHGAPVSHVGTIACSDTLIRNALARDVIRDKYEAICLDHKLAGLAIEFPGLVIRGISDYADSHADDCWQPYAVASAAACARDVLLSFA
ncbi:purine and uridine phosphorylase, partial [Aspergillus sclerotiicarbonarius CBS 121057]